MRRLALGTAQFGLTYGVANSAGQVVGSSVALILARAADAGVDTLDTAVAYGESEAVLGRAGLSGWKVVSKLPPLPPEIPRYLTSAKTFRHSGFGRSRKSEQHSLTLLPFRLASTIGRSSAT